MLHQMAKLANRSRLQTALVQQAVARPVVSQPQMDFGFFSRNKKFNLDKEIDEAKKTPEDLDKGAEKDFKEADQADKAAAEQAATQ
jgi:molecular chaperone GrpE